VIFSGPHLLVPTAPGAPSARRAATRE